MTSPSPQHTHTQAMLQDDILCLVLSHPAIKQFLYTPRHKSSPETLRTPPEGKTRTVFTVRYRCLCEIISCGNGGGEDSNVGHSFLHSSILITVSLPVLILNHNLFTFAYCMPFYTWFPPHMLIISSSRPSIPNSSTPLHLRFSTISLLYSSTSQGCMGTSRALPMT